MKNFTKRNEQHLPKERFRFLNQGNSDGVARIDSQEMINHALEDVGYEYLYVDGARISSKILFAAA